MSSSILAKVPIFSGLKQSDLDQLAQCSARRWFKRGSVVVTEGDPADGLYVVVSGRIKVLLSDNEGKEVVLTVESGRHVLVRLPCWIKSPDRRRSPRWKKLNC